MVRRLTNSLLGLVDCSHRKHRIDRLADRVENHRAEGGRKSSPSGEGRSQQAHRRTEAQEVDNHAGHKLVDRSLGTGRNVVLAEGSLGRVKRSLEGIGYRG